jgi:hypothetical protein
MTFIVGSHSNHAGVFLGAEDYVRTFGGELFQMGPTALVTAVLRTLNGKENKFSQRRRSAKHVVLDLERLLNGEWYTVIPKGSDNVRFRKGVEIKRFVIERQQLPQDSLMPLRTERNDRDGAVNFLFDEGDIFFHGVGEIIVSPAAQLFDVTVGQFVPAR